MEISLRYIYIKLESMLPVLFALIYLGGDTTTVSPEINIKDRVSILTGTCIAIFYIYKLIKEMGLKDNDSDIKKRLDKIEKYIDDEKLKNS